MTVNETNASLIFSYTGFQTKTIALSQLDVSQPIKIALSQGVVLEEIVVAGNGKANVLSRIKRKFSKSESSNIVYAADCLSPFHTTESKQHNTEDYGLITENKFLGTNDTPVSTLSLIHI